MDGKIRQHFRRGKPVFINLRGEFHIISGYGGTRLGGVITVATKSMESMSKFMKHGDGIVPGDQNRFAWLAFYKVRVVGNDGCNDFIDVLLGTVGVHPGTGALTATGVGVKVPQADQLIASRNFPDSHIGVVHRYIRDLFKFKSV